MVAQKTVKETYSTSVNIITRYTEGLVNTASSEVSLGIGKYNYALLAIYRLTGGRHDTVSRIVFTSVELRMVMTAQI